MSRGKWIAAVLVAVLLIAVAFVVYQIRFTFRERGAAAGFSVERISLINLIATPEKYHGKWVQVEGVCGFELEGNALYLSRDDRKHMITKNAIWANWDTLGVKSYDLSFMLEFNGRHVLVEGYFDAHDKGHLDLFSGAITNVTRIMTK